MMLFGTKGNKYMFGLEMTLIYFKYIVQKITRESNFIRIILQHIEVIQIFNIRVKAFMSQFFYILRI